MPCAVVHPTNHTKTSTDREAEEAKVIFPNVKNTGLDLNDIPIVIVHNGLHHFVGAHYPQPTFKHGILDICQHFQQARFIADSLKVKDEAVHRVVTTTAKTVATLAYNLERLFKTPTGDELAAAAAAREQGTQPPAKRVRHHSNDGDIIEYENAMTRDGTTSMTNLHCSCGVRKDNKKLLKEHIDRNHNEETGGVWRCAYTGCKTVCKGLNPEKALRKHVRNQHLGEWLYWCKYCTSYGKDQRHLVVNHIYRFHGLGQQLPCRNIGCQKMFPSFQCLKDHEQFCQQGKKYTCQFCTRKYKRVKNMKTHIKNMHLETGGKMLCSYCGRSYESLTTYKAHYNQNLCIKVIVPGMIEDVEDPQTDPDDTQEGSEEESEEEGGQDFAV